MNGKDVNMNKIKYVASEYRIPNIIKQLGNIKLKPHQYHYTPKRTVKIKKTDTKYWKRYGASRTLSAKGLSNVIITLENCWQHKPI